jgi:hypothetical protein
MIKSTLFLQLTVSLYVAVSNLIFQVHLNILVCLQLFRSCYDRVLSAHMFIETLGAVFD